MIFPFTEADAMRILSERLKPERLRHSVCVAECAQLLAGRYGYDEKIAKMTGLLHDICKNDNLDFQLQTIKNGGIMLTSIEKKVRRCIMRLRGLLISKQCCRLRMPMC